MAGRIIRWHLSTLNSLPPGQCGCYLQLAIPKPTFNIHILSIYWWNRPRVNATKLYVWLVNIDAVRQSDITWADIDSDICRHMASLSNTYAGLQGTRKWSSLILALDVLKSSTCTILTIHLVVWFLCAPMILLFCFGHPIGSSNMTCEISTNLVILWILTQLAPQNRTNECSELFWENFSECAAYGFGDKSSLCICSDYSTVYYLIVAKLKVDYVYYEALKNYQLSWRILKPNLSGRQHTTHPMGHTQKKLKNFSTHASDRWKATSQATGRFVKTCLIGEDCPYACIQYGAFSTGYLINNDVKDQCKSGPMEKHTQSLIVICFLGICMASTAPTS